MVFFGFRGVVMYKKDIRESQEGRKSCATPLPCVCFLGAVGFFLLIFYISPLCWIGDTIYSERIGYVVRSRVLFNEQIQKEVSFQCCQFTLVCLE